ncbi:MAG: chemotaxis protein CheC [Halobacillus sp.]|uniref:chemotaxis protein CheC n=2 Tax=Halobacillus sp. TaxID=56800 RepID=UPI003BB00FD0
MTFSDRFSAVQLDVLKEVGNIGAGHAATALSHLLERKIEMFVPSVQLADFDEVVELSGSSEEVVVSVYLKIEGDAPGGMFFILPPAQAERFVRIMTGDASFTIHNSNSMEIGVSALKELGNILSGSYLTALSDFTQLTLYPSVPSLNMDMAGAILSFGLLELSLVSDQGIVIETCLTDPSDESKESVEGHFFLFPDPDSYDTLFKALGVSDYD